MRVLSSLLFALCCFIPFSNAQQRDCGTMEYLEQQIETDPKRAAKMENIEKATKAILSDPNRVIDGIITIPVVVHIVWNTSAENLSVSQINSQLQILTDDFRRFNSDADGTWPQAADSEIEFCLATSDPSGNPHSGITRTNTSVTSFSTNDNVKFNSSGGHDAWPASDYMNFWVCDLSGGLLGYAQFPGGPASTDGIVCDYQYVGDQGTATPPYELGRTATHEVGHWLNLRHIWGDGGCGVDDNVSDTPLSDASNGGCPSNHQSCGSLDMVQNYMDYTFDSCMNLFTQGQKNRMRALFDPGGFRASLLQSTACGPVTPPTCDDGLQNGQETGVDCGGPECPECPPCPGTDVTLTILLDDYPEETTWTINDANGVTVASGGPYGNLPDGATVEEIICLEDGCYDLTIFDSANDGLCCVYGEGNYQLTDPDGIILASGAEFNSQETTNFCVSGAISGCTNPEAHNYDQEATIDDESCETCNDGILNGDEEEIDCGGILCGPCPIFGCTDPDAHNYNVEASDDDGSCETCNDGILNGDEEEIDCGGILCFPCELECDGTIVTLTIEMDRYPEETSWSLSSTDGNIVAEGGPYGNLVDYATVVEDFCLPAGCYKFAMYDSYGDGICCAYGEGSYELVDEDGTTLASGGVFEDVESTIFCVGDEEPNEGCTDETAHNYNPFADVDDGNCETCYDNEQNGDETGIDCGGELCAPCTIDDCVYEDIDFNDFDSEWGIWNDGGSDCRRTSSDAAYAYSDPRCVRLRDNSSSSNTTTDNLGLSFYDELTVDFTFITSSMENNEDFWLQISTDGGDSYTTLRGWARGSEFENDVRYFESVTIDGPFTNATRLRFRCDASSNGDRVYLDDILVTGCDNGGGNSRIITTESISTEEEDNTFITIDNIYPNPASNVVNVKFVASDEKEARIQLYDLTGKLMHSTVMNLNSGKQTESFDVSQFGNGIYFLHLTTDSQRIVKKFVVTR